MPFILVKQVDGLEKARLVVARDGQKDVMTLQVSGNNLSSEAIAEQLHQITKLKGIVETVDNLPNDGKVIDDLRDYSS